MPSKNFKWLLKRKEGISETFIWILDGASVIKNNLPDGIAMHRLKTLYDYGIPADDMTIEQICENYVSEILEIYKNKDRKITIGGYSMGAVFALQTASYLEKNGFEVKLVLLDPVEKVSTTWEEFVLNIKSVIRDENDLYRIVKKIYWLMLSGSLFIQIKKDIETAKSRWYSFFKISPPKYFRSKHVFLFYRRLRKNYVLPKFQGRILLMQRDLDIPYEDRIWPKIGDVEFHKIPTKDHSQVVKSKDLEILWLGIINDFLKAEGL